MSSSKCPACRGSRLSSFRARGGLDVLRCLVCSTCVLDSTAANGEFAYDAEYFESWNLAPGSATWRLRTATAELRLDTLEQMGVSEGNLLDIGAAGGYLVKLASERGFDAQGVEISEHAVEIAQSVIPGKVQRGTLDKLQLEPSCLDVITLFDVLEHLAEPREALQRLSGWLKPGGVIAVTIPDVDSLSARLMGGAWPHYKLEHRFYPSRRGLRMMLGGAGLEVVLDKSAKKCISLDFTAPLLRRYPVRLLTPIFDILHRAMPKAIRDASFEVSIGERLCIGRKG